MNAVCKSLTRNIMKGNLLVNFFDSYRMHNNRIKSLLHCPPFQYCLRWTRHPDMLSDALSENERSLQLSGQQTRSGNDSDSFLDVVIHLDDGSEVKLHSLVLAASSKLFQVIGQVRILIHLNKSRYRHL